MEGRRLLLVEDEPGMVATLQDRLTAEGYDVENVRDARSGLERVVGGAFDVILLDLMLPGGSGLEVCRAARLKGVLTPILMLTARGDVADRVVGLQTGADDYLVKPFEIVELIARIEALLRRRRVTPASEVIECGDLTIDLKKGQVARAGQIVEVSTREFDLLRYFVEHCDQVLSREHLLKDVWGHTDVPPSRTVDVHVAGLRQKLEDNPRHPRHILTVHKFGYRFACRERVEGSM
jgi:two-component system alkaline phosphatase synthesis response regulator PhoP